ncbi:MAG: hypothetical protein WDA27_01185 [Actinomycetota bacterium]
MPEGGGAGVDRRAPVLVPGDVVRARADGDADARAAFLFDEAVLVEAGCERDGAREEEAGEGAIPNAPPCAKLGGVRRDHQA